MPLHSPKLLRKPRDILGSDSWQLTSKNTSVYSSPYLPIPKGGQILDRIANHIAQKILKGIQETSGSHQSLGMRPITVPSDGGPASL